MHIEALHERIARHSADLTDEMVDGWITATSEAELRDELRLRLRERYAAYRALLEIERVQRSEQ